MALSPQEATQSCLFYFTLGPSLLKYLCYKTTKICSYCKHHQLPNFQITVWLDKSWKCSWWGSHICLVRQSTRSCVLVGGGIMMGIRAYVHWYSLYLENPSCLQATLASLASQKSSHTVPHWLFMQTSTRPWEELDPKPASLIAPAVQPAVYKHRKPRSLVCYTFDKQVE